MICVPHQMSLECSNKEEWDGRGMWYVGETGEVHTGCWWGDVREGDHLENLGIDGRIILILIFKA